MPHEGYADPVMNDGSRFHSDIPVSKLPEARYRWGTLWAPHRPYYREVGLGNKAYNPIAKKNAKQSNVQNRNSNANYTREGTQSVA